MLLGTGRGPLAGSPIRSGNGPAPPLPIVPGQLTGFALTGSVQVVIGAQEFALPIRATVVDTRGQVGSQVHLRSCQVPAGFQAEGETEDPAVSSSNRERGREGPGISLCSGEGTPLAWAGAGIAPACLPTPTPHPDSEREATCFPSERIKLP